jgi:hypothetical protein
MVGTHRLTQDVWANTPAGSYLRWYLVDLVAFHIHDREDFSKISAHDFTLEMCMDILYRKSLIIQRKFDTSPINSLESYFVEVEFDVDENVRETMGTAKESNELEIERKETEEKTGRRGKGFLGRLMAQLTLT